MGNDLRTAAQQALAFTMRDFASLRDFEAAKAVLYDILRAALAQQAEPVEPVALDWLHKWANQDDGEPETQWHEGYEAARRVVQIHLTTPPQQAEPVQEPHTRERHFALREAYCIGAADAFWKARPGTKDDGRAIAFDAGFARGFDKGTDLAEKRLAALEEPQEPVAAVAKNATAQFDHAIGADRFKVVGGAFWWHVLIGDSTKEHGKFHSRAGAEQMAADLLREFRNGAFVQHTAPPQRKPLTEEEIAAVTDEHWPAFVAFTRAIERAHGIKE